MTGPCGGLLTLPQERRHLLRLLRSLTGDRDLLQLADEGITIRLAGQKLKDSKDYGPAEVQERFGLTPTQYIDYKSLVGDTSDNIPGVADVGDKTATELLQKYGSLDAIYEHLESISDRCEDVANMIEGVVLENS